MLNYWEWQEREGDAMESERRRDERARFVPREPIDEFAAWLKLARVDTMADEPMGERQMREIYNEAKRTDNAILFGLLRRYVRLVTTTVMVLVFAPNVFAQSPVIAVEVTQLADGDYVLRKAGSVVTVRPLTLIPLGVPGPLPPVPTPDPVPVPPPDGTLSERAKTYRELARVVTDPQGGDTAIALSALYRQLGQAASDGQIADPQKLSLAVKAATDLLLARNAHAASWAPVRARLSDDWANLARRGAPMPEYVSLLNDAAHGIEHAVATPANRAINPDTLRLIIEIVKIILALFGK